MIVFVFLKVVICCLADPRETALPRLASSQRQKTMACLQEWLNTQVDPLLHSRPVSLALAASEPGSRRLGQLKMHGATGIIPMSQTQIHCLFVGLDLSFPQSYNQGAHVGLLPFSLLTPRLPASGVCEHEDFYCDNNIHICIPHHP